MNGEVNVNDECLVFYIFWLRTESTWKILKLDYKTLEKLLNFFLPKEWEPCVSLCDCVTVRPLIWSPFVSLHGWKILCCRCGYVGVTDIVWS